MNGTYWKISKAFLLSLWKWICELSLTEMFSGSLTGMQLSPVNFRNSRHIAHQPPPPPTYKFKDLKGGELIEGTFYEEDLQRVCPPEWKYLMPRGSTPSCMLSQNPVLAVNQHLFDSWCWVKKKITNVWFYYIYIFIGVDASENKILSHLLTDIPPSTTDVKIIEMMNLFSTKKEIIQDFPTQLKQMLGNQNRNGKKRECNFDDLMKELGEMAILLDLFTKISPHYNLSVIHITQNLFHMGSGKHSSNHIGVYCNSHITVLFNSPLNNHPLWTVAPRLVRKGLGALYWMLKDITEMHRYVIHGGMDWPKKLHFMTDLFGKTEGVERQRVYELLSDWENYAERERKMEIFQMIMVKCTIQHQWSSTLESKGVNCSKLLCLHRQHH